ncbi:uncharacterized protein SOCE26_018750 [Sorangium cellulosum]|uniref:Uncharacterized protein n=1 Tax=Sorangium cellulosum TaxID=56 RepID=A0A2L0EME6_SORCE|nr:hypothetical protein [Sorangium cellulosum]AUX40474.1 uncharacterized protein SOCE26_018750 [Sorangium cellulosum]
MSKVFVKDRGNTNTIHLDGERGDTILQNADCAEEFDVSSNVALDPGTVLVIGEGERLEECTRAYDRRVAGVVSGAGEYRPGIVLDRRQTRSRRGPVAPVGKVYCKVDAGYRPIEVGDLLTTSPTPGHAMKADDPREAFGAVIGKALRRCAAASPAVKASRHRGPTVRPRGTRWLT